MDGLFWPAVLSTAEDTSDGSSMTDEHIQTCLAVICVDINDIILTLRVFNSCENSQKRGIVVSLSCLRTYCNRPSELV